MYAFYAESVKIKKAETLRKQPFCLAREERLERPTLGFGDRFSVFVTDRLCLCYRHVVAGL